MDNNKRFDQLESLLVDLARKVDQQADILAQHGEALTQLTHSMARQETRLDTIETRLDTISDQIGDIINILKISEARHTQAEQRQDAILVEIQR